MVNAVLVDTRGKGITIEGIGKESIIHNELLIG
jgi:hypothetical protein